MDFKNQLINVSGEKIECLYFADNALQLLSKSVSSVNEFQEAWTKKLSLSTKIEIEYQNIKSITKEENEDEVVVSHKGFAGVGNSTKLTFANESEREAFYHFFQKHYGFVRTDEKLSTIKSTLPYAGGFAFSVISTIYAYKKAIEMANGNIERAEGYSRSARKSRSFDNLIEMLGTNGVLLVGSCLIGYTLYMIWTRFKNPPILTKLSSGK
jgi:hypothetical protein